MRTKRFMIVAALALATALTMGFKIHNSSIAENNGVEFIQQNTGEWAGKVWVEEIPQGPEGRKVTHWHLMATNTTGVGHCICGYIKDNGRKIEVVGYVSAYAVDKKNAESIFDLTHEFLIVKDSFKADDSGLRCL